MIASAETCNIYKRWEKPTILNTLEKKTQREQWLDKLINKPSSAGFFITNMITANRFLYRAAVTLY